MIWFVQVVLIVLKLTGVVTWPWLWVMIPAMIGLGLVVVPFVLFAIVAMFIGTVTFTADRMSRRK